MIIEKKSKTLNKIYNVKFRKALKTAIIILSIFFFKTFMREKCYGKKNIKKKHNNIANKIKFEEISENFRASMHNLESKFPDKALKLINAN